MTAPSTQTVGQSLTLQCSVTTVRGITSRVDIIWSSNGTVLRTVSGYSDSYTITQLSTTDEDRIYECMVVINTSPPITAISSVRLDVNSKCLVQLH